jgi:hypothetical protein
MKKRKMRTLRLDMRGSFWSMGLLALCMVLVIARPVCTQSETPAFRVQVARFVALALSGARDDYAPFVLDGKGGAERQAAMHANAAAIAPTFATCAALRSDEPGFPISMICTSEWMPAATAKKLYAEGEAAITQSLPTGAILSTAPLSGSWLVGNQRFTFFAYEPPKRTDIQALVLSSSSYQHLARSPLAASIKTAITQGLRALPEGFARIRSNTADGFFYDVTEKFGPGLPDCRIHAIDAVENPQMDCFTPAYADKADAVFSAAKDAVTAALPSGFSAVNCPRERQCHWEGPTKQHIALAIGVIPPHSDAYGVRIMFSRNK